MYHEEWEAPPVIYKIEAITVETPGLYCIKVVSSGPDNYLWVPKDQVTISGSALLVPAHVNDSLVKVTEDWYKICSN